MQFPTAYSHCSYYPRLLLSIGELWMAAHLLHELKLQYGRHP